MEHSFTGSQRCSFGRNLRIKFMSNQYWNEQTQGFDRGIGNLGQAFMTIPRYAMMAKYRQQMLNTMGAREQAEGQESAARTALLTGQLAHLQSGDAAVNAAGK